MKVDFRRLTWQNYPSEETPINADNLNRLEEGVAGLYSDVAEIEEELGEGVGEYVTSWLNEHVDPVGSAVVVDDTLTIQGAAADAKKTGDEISGLKEEISHIGGLSEDIKQALLQIAEKVAYIDEDGQDYYDALEDALYPPADLVSISAVYTQSGTVYDTDTLGSLKSDLVVTARYDDSTTETVTTYTLSGTLAVGTSTITVAYGGKTAMFTVTVTEKPITWDFEWNYTDGLMSENGFTKSETGSSAETLEDDGVHLKSVVSTYIRMVATDVQTCSNGVAEYVFRGTNFSQTIGQGVRFILTTGSRGLQIYLNGSTIKYQSGSSIVDTESQIVVNDGNDHTIRLEFNKYGTNYIYVDGTLIYESTTFSAANLPVNYIYSQGGTDVYMKSVKYQYNCF